MDSISVPLSLASVSEYTEKQEKLLSELNSCISKIGIEVSINHVPSGEFQGQTLALDVEHDESGGFVGCGIYPDASHFAYYYTDLDILGRLHSQSWQVVAHNGVSDLECLRMWGIPVSDDQLFWDTMLIGHIIDSSKKDYGLKGMAKRELEIEYPSYDDIVGKRGLKAPRVTLDKQPLALVAAYNAMDCYVTYKLYELQRKVLGNVPL